MKIRLYGDISAEHEANFLLIKGALGCKNNGEALEQVIELTTPIIRKNLASAKEMGKRA